MDTALELMSLPATLAGVPRHRAQALEALATRLLGDEWQVFWPRPMDEVVPHKMLRQAMLADPALEALLPISPLTFTVDALVEGDFELGPGNLARLAPVLLGDLKRLSRAARAAIEHRFVEGREVPKGHQSELQKSLEELLVAGGDNRLAVDPQTGMNRYGTTPYPRFDAVQFSSSTASSISDTAFWFCELVRAHWLRRWLVNPEQAAALRNELADRVQAEILALIGIDNEAEAILCASGTDTELLAVLLGLAAGDRPVTNILIAPEESGRGVLIAGEGHFFDSVTQTGAHVAKGEPVWSDARIETVLVTIRDADGSDRSPEDIANEVVAQTEQAIEAGHHVLVHQLLASKTGLSAPEFATLEILKRQHPDRVDIVVDTCQMRIAPKLLGDLARRGWLLQISGSKAYTGPPFSGALVVPISLRKRMQRVGARLDDATQITQASDWPAVWRPELPPSTDIASYGPLLRWIAALVEVTLVEALPVQACRIAYDRFRATLEQRIWSSDILMPLADRGNELVDWETTTLNFSGHSIISFAVRRANHKDLAEAQKYLDMDACQRLFEMLNRDLTALLPDASAADKALLAMPAHIGQPVALRPDVPPVLRLVIGARFFTIVGFGPRGSEDAALISEISDAVRAIEKLELLVRHWDDIAE